MTASTSLYRTADYYALIGMPQEAKNIRSIADTAARSEECVVAMQAAADMPHDARARRLFGSDWLRWEAEAAE